MINNNVHDHSWPFKTNTPPVDVDIFGETHRLQHLWSEHTAVSNFDPFFELRVECEDF